MAVSSGWSWQKFVSCTVTIWAAHSSHEASGVEVMAGNSKALKTSARTRNPPITSKAQIEGRTLYAQRGLFEHSKPEKSQGRIG
jgi:hypothetical protein